MVNKLKKIWWWIQDNFSWFSRRAETDLIINLIIIILQVITIILILGGKR